MSALAIPGDVGIADVSIFRDGYAVVRVVKANDLGKMWTIQIRETVVFHPLENDWSEPKKRKVGRWLPIDPDQADLARVRLRERYDELHKAENELRRVYHADVLDLAFRSYTP